jgi:hypothetical protein
MDLLNAISFLLGEKLIANPLSAKCLLPIGSVKNATIKILQKDKNATNATSPKLLIANS